MNKEIEIVLKCEKKKKVVKEAAKPENPEPVRA